MGRAYIEIAEAKKDNQILQDALIHLEKAHTIYDFDHYPSFYAALRYEFARAYFLNFQFTREVVIEP